MYTRWREWVSDRWELSTLLGFGSGLLIVIAYLWRLGAKPFGASETNLVNSLSLQNIKDNPLNAPHNLLLLALKHWHHAGPTGARLISVIFALIIIVCFYLMVKFWLGRFGGWLGALMLSFTPLFMLAGRNAGNSLMVLLPIVSIVAYMWMLRGGKVSLWRLLALTLAAVLSAYSPGGLIVLIVGAIYERHNLAKLFKAASTFSLAVNIVVLLALLTPIGWASARHAATLEQFFLVPATWLGATVIVKSIGWSVLALFWHSSTHHVLQVGQLAILDATEIVLALFGFYALWSKAPKKLYPLIFIAACGVLASAINQNYDLLLVCIIPILVVAATGLRYLYLEWTRVFPRNPLPRGLALIILVTVIVVHIAWGAHYSLTAWPHSLPVR
ncbi:MAG TPA: hypothetical protein VFT49_01520 [Candidatus Saccharimonadales bacterium]|nr:hypothetical protein [Candidatus Saccharimonadales bacterium]